MRNVEEPLLDSYKVETVLRCSMVKGQYDKVNYEFIAEV